MMSKAIKWMPCLRDRESSYRSQKQKLVNSEYIFLKLNVSCMVSYFVCVCLDMTTWQETHCFNPRCFFLLES